jgi:hypothetical protein
MIKYKKHSVENTVTKTKCRVYYSVDNRADKRRCVTLWAKTCLDKLSPVIDNVINKSEYVSDYVESDYVDIFENHPDYLTARTIAEKIADERHQKFENKMKNKTPYFN